MLATRPTEDQEALISSYTPEQQLALAYDWRFWARPKQLAPPGDWSLWMLRAGRGFGKTRTGTGWVHERAMAVPGRWIALVAKTPADARDVMIEGPGGFLDRAGKNIHPAERPLYEPSKRRLTWPNGSWATIFSSEEPEQLRGFSGDTAWLDEFGKYANARDVWDNLQFGMREASDDQPRKLITTTPKPLMILKELERQSGTVVVTGSSYDNQSNLDPKWFSETVAAYEGTQFGRQEIHGEILDPEETGIVRRTSFNLWPADKPLPAFEAVILSLDTALTEDARDRKKQEADPTAGQVWGLFQHKGKMALLVLDCWAEYLGFPELIERIKSLQKATYGAVEEVAMFGPLVKAAWDTLPAQGRRLDLTIIEDKGSGISARQTLAREGIITYPYNPGRASKLTRLHLVSHVFEKRFVWLVESEKKAGNPKAWYEPMIAQLCTFTGEGSTDHDDHVDAATQAVRYFLDRHLVSVDEASKVDDPHVPKKLAEDAYHHGGGPVINIYAQ
jgi:predicted phage terminase large subunit-like protein